jgi:hypothetical protein
MPSSRERARTLARGHWTGRNKANAAMSRSSALGVSVALNQTIGELASKR